MKRTYELTVLLPKKGITKKIKYRSIDSVHASTEVIRLFGEKSRAKVISAILLKEDTKK